MKLATAAGVVLASAGFTHAANGDHCRAKNPDVNKAIAEFCSRKNLVVPSDWSTKGKYSVYTRVSIDANCNPPQWVPQNYCNIQMWTVCAQSPNDTGSNWKQYGRNKCQKWRIESTKNSKPEMTQDEWDAIRPSKKKKKPKKPKLSLGSKKKKPKKAKKPKKKKGGK